MQILNKQQELLLRSERKILNDLRLVMTRFGALPEDNDLLGGSIEQLDELFLLVVVGEFNAGKSAFINALLGQKLLQEGVTPTTTQINVLRYGAIQSRTVISEHQHVITLPADLLSEISIVDTPGTNAIIREHELITAQFIPRADLVLFVTSADRPFTESERLFLAKIRDWGKKVVMVINKTDILQTQADREEVRQYVTENARALLGVTPDVYMVSARNALQAKQGVARSGRDSGFDALEAYIHDRLDEKGRLRLKLLSPLGIGLCLVDKYVDLVAERQRLLEKDFQMLVDVESQLELYAQDHRRDFRFRLSDVENPLYELQQRGDSFFDAAFQLTRVVDLIKKERIQHEFEQQVVADVPQRIELKVNEVIDWMIDSQLRQWQAVTRYIAERRREHQSAMIGGGAERDSFDYDRERLMDALGREARAVVDTFDRTNEARLIAADAQTTIATSFAVEVGAVGLGALVTVLATTAAADLTGILSAGVVAALGLFIIPARRTLAKRKLEEKISAIRAQLLQSLTAAFEKELTRSQEQIREAIAPYTRFVRAESSKLQEANDQFRSIRSELERLKGSIENI
jgi:small GTP-binding protein